MQVKACQKVRSDCLYALVQKPIQAVIKLSRAYFTPIWYGLSFKIIDVYCKEWEPKEEWVPTPLNESEVEVAPEQM